MPSQVCLVCNIDHVHECTYQELGVDHVERPRTSEAARLQITVQDGISLGRGDKIRTCDPLLPKQVRYQTALRPAAGEYSAAPAPRLAVGITVAYAARHTRTEVEGGDASADERDHAAVLGG